METFVISDTHFDHAEVLKYSNRPWCLPNPEYDPAKPFDFKLNHPLMVTKEALEAHNHALQDNWNRMVGTKDRVIIIGDFALTNVAKWASSLNGHKILIRGNHDDLNKTDKSQFIEIQDFGCVKGMDTGRLFNGKAVKETVSFCHYAMRSWANSCDGAASLYGHSHGRMPEWDSVVAFDVGVDVWGYSPIPWEAIQKKIELKRTLKLSCCVNGANGDEWVPTRGSYPTDPERRVIETREKNLAILKSVGVTFGPDSMVIPKPLPQPYLPSCKVMSAVVAVADTVNRNGRLYTKEALRQIADDKVFFWDEESGKLSIKVTAGVMFDREAVADLFKTRISEVGTTIWTKQA